MYDKHIEKTMDMLDSKETIDRIAQPVAYEKIVANDYNLSVSSYGEAKDTREVIDIAELNVEIKTTVGKINRLRSDIDAIINEIDP